MQIDYQETAHGWLPKAWTFTLAADGRRQSEEHCTVAAVTINPPVTDADFHFPEEPGMLIAASTAGGLPDPRRLMVFGAENQYYRVGPDGRRHEVTFANGVEQPVEPSAAWRPVGVLGLVVVAGIGVCLLWRRPMAPGIPRL